MKNEKKLLSVFLAIVMVMTSLSCGFVAFAAGKDSVTTAQWDALVTALKTDGVASANPSTSSNTATFTDKTGEILTAVEAYWSVFTTIGATGQTQTNTTYRTATMITDLIKTEVGTRTTAQERSDYNINGFLDSLKAGVSVNSSTSLTSAPSAPTVTIRVFNYRGLLAYATIAALPDNVMVERVFKVEHESSSYKDNCNTRYFLRIKSMSASDGTGVINTVNLKAFQPKLAAFDDVAALSFDELVVCAFDDLTAWYNSLKEDYDATVADYGSVVVDHFYPGAVDLLSDLESALQIAQYIPLANEITELCATDYSEYGLSALESLYNTILAKLNTYKALKADVREYIEAHVFDLEAAEATLDDILDMYEVAQLREFKPTVDAAVEAAYALTEDDVIGTDKNNYAPAYDANALSAVLGEINGYKTALGTYKEANVKLVFGDTVFADLDDCIAYVQNLIDLSGCDAQFASEYAYFTGTVWAAVDIDDSSDELLGAIRGYDGWFTSLKNFCDQIEAQFGEATAAKVFGDYLELMSSRMDSRYNALFARVKAEIETADALYQKVVEVYGEEVTVLSVDTYGKLRSAIGAMESDAIDFLIESPNFEFDQPTYETYLALKALVFDEYEDFLSSGGFSNYIQSDIADIVRSVSAADIARDKDYVVTDEKVEQIIALLEKLLRSKELGGLLDLDLAGTLSGLLDKIYTNDFLNTLVQYVYPLVTKEFAKVWADLPSVVQADNPVGSGKIDVTLSLYTIEQAMNSIKFYILPSILGARITDPRYSDVAAKLRAVTMPCKYHPDTDEMDNPWEDPSLLNEEGKLDLDWGITDRESFLDAASVALQGLEPLFMALLSNKGINGNHDSEPSGSEPGHGKVGTGKTSVKILITISVDVDPITLYLDVAGNSGYNNAIVPILELLDLDPSDIPNGNEFTGIRDVFEHGLFEPIDALIEKLSASPLDYILGILPNLSYAVSMQRIKPLLQMLKTTIAYHADAHYSAVGGLAAGDIDQALQSDEPIAINIGDMLNLEDLGLDLSSLDALLKLLTGSLGIDLPSIDAGTLATLGELTQRPTKRNAKTYDWGDAGKAAYIEANKADVLIFLLEYVLKALNDEEFLTQIMGLFSGGSDEEVPEGEEAPPADPVEISETLMNIIKGIANDPDMAIAAITELVFPQDYTEPEGVQWILPEETEELTPEQQAYLDELNSDYDEFWTKEKAEYVAENLPTFVDNVISLVGLDGEASDAEGALGRTVSGLIDGLFTADTVNSIASGLGGFLGKVNLPDFLADVLKDQLGLDFHYLDEYSADFADGDRDAFKAALTDVLSPLQSVLEALLCDRDLTIEITDKDTEEKAQLIKLQGYMGYSNGLIPLLEALGAEGVMTPAQFAADKENLVPNLIDMLLSVVDKVEADPLNAIVDLLPQLAYFLECGGLTTAMDNILYAANIALDTIRPIYDVNIYDLVDFDLRFAQTDFISFLFEKLSGAIYDATGLNFSVDFTVDSLYDALSYGTPEPFDSKNGTTAYRLGNIDKTALVDTVVGYVIDEVIFSDNTDAYLEYIKERFGLNDTLYAFVVGVISGIRYAEGEEKSAGKALLFWVFFGADTVADAVLDYYRIRQEEPLDILIDMSTSGIEIIGKTEFMIEELYKASYHTTFVELTGRKVDPAVQEEVIQTAGAIAEISVTALRIFRLIVAYIRMLLSLIKK